MPRQTDLMLCRDFRGKTSAVLTREGTSVLLHLPTDEEDIISFLQIQLAGNLKGPLDCPCNCWKIREQRREKNAARTAMGWRGGRGGGGGGILQSNISYAINPIWIDIRPSHTVKNKAKLLLLTVQMQTGRKIKIGREVERKAQKRRRDHAAQHLCDCYLGATVSNYWLKPWRSWLQAVTVSSRQADNQMDRWTDGWTDKADLTPSSVQLSPCTSTQSRPGYHA